MNETWVFPTAEQLVLRVGRRTSPGEIGHTRAGVTTQPGHDKASLIASTKVILRLTELDTRVWRQSNDR